MGEIVVTYYGGIYFFFVPRAISGKIEMRPIFENAFFNTDANS